MDPLIAKALALDELSAAMTRQFLAHQRSDEALPPQPPATALPAVTFAALRAGLPEIDESAYETTRPRSGKASAQHRKRKLAAALAAASGAPLAPTSTDARGRAAVKRIRLLLAGGGGGGGAAVEPSAAAAAAAASAARSPNWGLTALGWWLLEHGREALPQRAVPAAARAAPPAAAAQAAHAAAAAAASAGPTALADLAPLPGWGDLRCRAVPGLLAAPPLRCLGLEPPALHPYATAAPALQGALAVCVYTAPTVIHHPATRVDARTVALRAGRARSELLRSSEFLPETALRAYLRDQEQQHSEADAAGEGAGAAPAAAAAASAGAQRDRASHERDRLGRRVAFIESVRSGRVPELDCLRIGAAEAGALGVPPEAPYSSEGASEGASASALPLHLNTSQALLVTDPLSLCKRVVGSAQSARRQWDLSVEASVQHLPVLSLRELPDAAWVIR